MDEALARAVRDVFVRLYSEGLIYRDRYIVNWCPGARRRLGPRDRHVTRRAALHDSYPFARGSGGIDVATTRPETMLGDTGVAVHPDDERYRSAVGRSSRCR
jgi:valyl-tRNA synthetase